MAEISSAVRRGKRTADPFTGTSVCIARPLPIAPLSRHIRPRKIAPAPRTAPAERMPKEEEEENGAQSASFCIGPAELLTTRLSLRVLLLLFSAILLQLPLIPARLLLLSISLHPPFPPQLLLRFLLLLAISFPFQAPPTLLHRTSLLLRTLA